MTQDHRSSLVQTSQPTLLGQLMSLASPQRPHSINSKMSGRDPSYRRSAILHTKAKAVLDSHAALSRFNVEPSILPPSTDWDAYTAQETEARTKLKNSIDAFNMTVIIDQKSHGIPTDTELAGFEAGTIREEVGPSEAFLQLCTALSLDPDIGTKADIVEWSKDDPRYSNLHKTLKFGQWPEQE